MAAKCECGNELIGEEETVPGRCLPCQRTLLGQVADAEDAAPGLSAPVDLSDAPSCLVLSCEACLGAGGKLICVAERGEEWRRCSECRGDGVVRVGG